MRINVCDQVVLSFCCQIQKTDYHKSKINFTVFYHNKSPLEYITGWTIVLVQLISFKGTWSVHSFYGDYLSIPKSGQGAVGTFFMKSPVGCVSAITLYLLLVYKVVQYTVGIKLKNKFMDNILCIDGSCAKYVFKKKGRWLLYFI